MANCYHPGLVASGFNRNNGLLMDLAMTMLRPASRSVEKGAETLVWLAASPDVPKTNGAYYIDMETRPTSREAQDMQTAARLWEVSAAQCPSMERTAENLS